MANRQLREKCPNTEFFWPVFSRIMTVYGKIRTRKNSLFGNFSHNDHLWITTLKMEEYLSASHHFPLRKNFFIFHKGFLQ